MWLIIERRYTLFLFLQTKNGEKNFHVPEFLYQVSHVVMFTWYCFFLSLATCFPCLWSCFVFFSSFFYAKQQQHAYHMLQFPSYKWWLQLWVCLYLFFIRFEPKSQTYICSRLCFLFFLKQNTKKKQKKILNNFLFCWWFSFRQLLVVCTIFFLLFNFLINIMLFIITVWRLYDTLVQSFSLSITFFCRIYGMWIYVVVYFGLTFIGLFIFFLCKIESYLH